MFFRSLPCPRKPDLPEVESELPIFEMETELPSLHKCLKKRGREKQEQAL